MQKDLDENSYEKRIENIQKGKSYLKSNGFFRSKSNLFDDIQKLSSFLNYYALKLKVYRNSFFLKFLISIMKNKLKIKFSEKR